MSNPKAAPVLAGAAFVGLKPLSLTALASSPDRGALGRPGRSEQDAWVFPVVKGRALLSRLESL